MFFRWLPQWLPAQMTAWLYLLLLTELMIISWIDLRTKKISNLWSVLNVVLAIVAWSMGLLSPWSYQVLFFPVGFVVIGFFLFNLGIMGAGDSKLLATLFLCLQLSYHLVYFEQLLYATLAVGFILLSLRVLKKWRDFRSLILGQHWQGLLTMIKSHFSYAPVMLLAWLLLGVKVWL
jgi:prepilin peptidase CpaA